jgi:hypothetical protein
MKPILILLASALLALKASAEPVDTIVGSMPGTYSGTNRCVWLSREVVGTKQEVITYWFLVKRSKSVVYRQKPMRREDGTYWMSYVMVKSPTLR